MRLTFACMAAAALALAAAPSQAEGWSFVFEPYFMAPYMDGSTSVGPVTARAISR